MSGSRRTAPPSGMPPPTSAATPAGERVELVPLAEAVAVRHLDQHPEDVARYGRDLAWQWCVHDMQHVLAWAISDQDFEGQLTWLARVLDARDYPVNNLVDCTLTAADVVEAQVPGRDGREVAQRMRAAADTLRTA
jgi:hypothetical protein